MYLMMPFLLKKSVTTNFSQSVRTSYVLVDMVDRNIPSFFVSITLHSLAYACIATLMHTNVAIGHLNFLISYKAYLYEIKTHPNFNL